jgi:hypothetical protein
MEIFPFKFNKPSRYSIMFLFNISIFFFILIAIGFVYRHKCQNILTVLNKNLFRYNQLKIFSNKKNFTFSKIHIIDNNKIYTVELFSNYKFSEKNNYMIPIENLIKSIDNNCQVKFINNNNKLLIIIYNVTDKNYIEKFNHIISDYFYKNI